MRDNTLTHSAPAEPLPEFRCSFRGALVASIHEARPSAPAKRTDGAEPYLSGSTGRGSPCLGLCPLPADV
jgi:hypothetical protein